MGVSRILLFATVVLFLNTASAYTCPSGKFSGPCWLWSGDKCRRICGEEGRGSGHCSANLWCLCEDC